MVGYAVANARLGQKNLDNYLNSLLADQNRIGGVLQDLTNLNAGEISELFGEGRTKDAAFAPDKGLVHRVCDVNMPVGSP